MILETRTQNGQEFMKAAKINIGDVVWKVAYDINVDKSWLEGPYFVVNFVHKDTMSEHLALFSTHNKEEVRARYSDLYVPIIDKIDPPAGHNL